MFVGHPIESGSNTALDAAESWRHSHLPSGVSLMRSSPGPIRRLALIPFPRSAVSNTSATRHSLLWRLQSFFCTQPKHVSALCFFRTFKDISSYGCGSSFKLIRIRLLMRIRILPFRLQSFTNYLFERHFFFTFYFSNIINVKNLSRRYRFVDFNCFYFSYFNSYVNNIGRCRVSDPDSIRPVDPDPDSESGSGRAKMTHKSREKKLYKFMFWSVGWPLLRAEGLFCNLDILYGGLGISKLQFLI